MMTNKLFACSLYCEGNGMVKSWPFATVREDLPAAVAAGIIQVRLSFPEERGWHNHKCIAVEIPQEIARHVQDANGAMMNALRLLRDVRQYISTDMPGGGQALEDINEFLGAG